MGIEPSQVGHFGRLVPNRLREAREAACLNQTDLAEMIGVTPSAVSQYESGVKQPDPETLVKICHKLEMPVGFFLNERPEGADSSATLFFRSFKSKTKTANRKLNIWRAWAAQLAHYLEQFLDLPSVSVPTFDLTSPFTDEQIEQAATMLRRFWGLGDGPIANVVALLESKGFIIIRMPFDFDEVDAFSCWQNGRPYIFLADDKSCAVRSRFDGPHEAAHLILHRNLAMADLEYADTLNRVEKEANQFSSAFLMPERTFPTEVFSANVRQFLHLKKRWKVSVAAMIKRCKTLGIIDDDQYLNLRKELSRQRWLKREPLDDELEPEKPTLLKKAVELCANSKLVAASDYVNALKLPVHVLAQVGGFSPDLLSEDEAAGVCVAVNFRAA